MKAVFCVLTVCCGLLLLSGNSVQAGGTIKVKFTNKTNRTVTFFLNGGKGLETRLKAGASSGFTMATDDGVTPTIKIYQTSGSPRTFTVANGGVYSFQNKDGGVSNFFDE